MSRGRFLRRLHRSSSDTLTQRSGERFKHLRNRLQFFLQVREIDRRQITEVPTEEQEITQLFEGTVREGDELKQFSCRLPAEAFRDVCWNRISGAAKLGDDPKLLAARKWIRQPIHFQHRGVGPIPDFKIAIALQHGCSPCTWLTGSMVFTEHGTRITAHSSPNSFATFATRLRM